MNRRNRFLRVEWIVALAALLVVAARTPGCSESNDEGSPVETQNDATIVGQVTSIDDRVPVDGGVTILVGALGTSGGATTLYFPSLFTDPPASPERLALYEVIQTLAVGDWVEAAGVIRNGQIELLEIEKVSAPD